ncbi:MAG: hypothetical protein WCH09_04075 [Bacteroidota bacterium]|jgi:hypothetical protein
MGGGIMKLSDAIDKGLATLGWNAQPEGWYWIDYGTLCAWVDPEAVDLIEGRVEWEKA